MTLMTKTLKPEDDTSNALADFNDGFDDGWKSKPREKNRGGQYLRSYKRAEQLRKEEDEGGVDIAAVRRRK